MALQFLCVINNPAAARKKSLQRHSALHILWKVMQIYGEKSNPLPVKCCHLTEICPSNGQSPLIKSNNMKEGSLRIVKNRGGIINDTRNP
jgi:hypothetical protein